MAITTLEPFGRHLQKADRLLAIVENGLNFVAGAIVFGLMFLGVAQIFLRTVFRTPMYGYIDIVELSMVGFAVLSISFVQRVGGHVRMEMLVARLKGRWHWGAEAIGTALSMFIVTILIPFSYRHFDRAFSFGDSTIDIELSTWPAKLVVPIALSILLVRLVIQFFGYLRLIAQPDCEPVAVPLLKNVAEQAEDEILHAEEDIRHEHLSKAERGDGS
ncbi:MAG: TRAP transporter small permease [Rhodospirillales bacterium]|nr:TRAP transporter small permease [Rhodospirillales bacterium]